MTNNKQQSTNNTPNVLESFDSIGSSFAKDYLNTYYKSELTVDEQIALKFFAREYARLESKVEMLEIGCGPGIYHQLVAAPYIGGIRMTDYLPECIAEIEKWWRRDPSAHDLRMFTRYTLSIEGHSNDDPSVHEREELLRGKIRSLGLCDVRQKYPLGTPQTYSAVASLYTAEQATMALESTPHEERLQVWNAIMDNIVSCVASRGWLFMAGVCETDYYVTYDHQSNEPLIHPLPYLKKNDYIQMLERNGFDLSEGTITQESLQDQHTEGLSSIVLLALRRM